ncbi:Frataxin-like domain-containing protein [Mucidula mucida]|nr:Frataxin-like domain-containing protein [Mucidula mucida]
MDTLVEHLEQLLDESEHQEYELDYSVRHFRRSGVLTLKLGAHGTYVINKQPPNKQIWLSSPLSGPKRYDYSLPDGSWRYSRDSTLLIDLLNEELSSAFHKALNLSLSSN